MNETAIILLTLGCLFLLGLLTDYVGRRTALPRVSLLLVFGFLIGPAVLNLLPDLSQQWFPLITNIALVMVGFLLGENLTVQKLKNHGKSVFFISFSVVLGTITSVFLGLWLFEVPIITALLLAAIAPATDPIATSDVIDELKAKGPFSSTLKGIVAVDDAWGLFAFSLILSMIPLVNGDGVHHEHLLLALWEIGGGLLLGTLVGVPMAFLTGRIQPGEPTLTEALGLVFLCGGLSLWLEVSYLLAAMSLGCTVANLAKHHTQPFQAIEGIEWPFKIMFFVLAGASLGFSTLLDIGIIGSGYIIFRILGRIVGAWIGASFAGGTGNTRKWIGISLLPQAGVALGMALLAIQDYPEYADSILPVVIASTVVFEIIGPIFVSVALSRVKEIPSI